MWPQDAPGQRCCTLVVDTGGATRHIIATALQTARLFVLAALSGAAHVALAPRSYQAIAGSLFVTEAWISPTGRSTTRPAICWRAAGHSNVLRCGYDMPGLSAGLLPALNWQVRAHKRRSDMLLNPSIRLLL